MSKTIPLEFYNHLRNAREAKYRAAYAYSRAQVDTTEYTTAVREYVRALNAYTCALAFRDILEREQLNQEDEQ